jgi:O-antigen/teichoic acid export membrane protein
LSDNPTQLASGRVLARNAGLNLFGLVTPMLAALVTIPLLIRGMGTERFGFITVAWVVIGYFSLFDLGIARALTKLVAERLGKGRKDEIPALTWTALFLMTALGIVGGVIIASLAGWLVNDALTIPPELRQEALTSFYLLAFSLPWVITTAGLRGLLEANQSFGLVNALRVPMGLFTYIGPVAVLPFSRSLVVVIATLVVGRVIACVAHLVICLRVFPSLRRSQTVGRREMRDLMRIGGWMTVSNVVSPLMTHVDRFLIAAFISMTAVAYYVTPYEVITKLWLVPSALLGVLFPAFASAYAQDHARTSQLFDRGVRAVFLVMFPAILVVVTLAHEGLSLWLGAEFAANSARVLQWLAVGVFINSLGQVPYAVVQGIGRPDITGKLHLLELPFYLLAIWWLGRTHGIEGVAIAWALRATVDTTLLFIATRRFLPASAADLRRTAQMIVVSLAVLALGAVDAGLGLKLTLLGAFLALFGLVGWYRILAPSERMLVRG